MTPSNEKIPPIETIQEHPGIHFRVSVDRLIGFVQNKKNYKRRRVIKVIQRAFLTDYDGSVFRSLAKYPAPFF